LAERLALELGAPRDRAPHEALSEREFEILKLIARGPGLKDIAEKLHISPKTVTTYRARILEKTGLTSNAALVRYMVEHALID
jgi:DNA-binding NarL/FixJ family response regulator